MTEPPNETEIGAVRNTSRILETIIELRGASLKQLDAEISLSKSTIHTHLQTLDDIGYVRKESDTYTIGMGAVQLGGFARDNHVLSEVAREPANQIAHESGELAMVTVPNRGKSMYLYQARGQNAVTTDSYLGIRLPMHCTGSGKAMLAEMDQDRVQSVLDETDLTEFTPNTITDPATLADELDQIRAEGVAYDDEERISGMRGVSAPITDRNTGEIAGSISLTGPTSRLKGEVFREELPELVKRVAEMIEVDYTYSE